MNNPSSDKKRFDFPNPGLGLGLRSPHYPYILQNQPQVDWFEIISENYIDIGGWAAYVLDWVAERYPIAMHGVSLSIGSTDEINVTYLNKLKSLAARTRALWVSDHLCWTGIMGHNTHDLLPMPLNEESLKHVIQRVKMVQEILERPLVLENPSSYLSFVDDTYTEWDFITHVAEEADCGILLDVNNVYVSSVNHGFDAYQYIDNIPHHRVVQMHIAGHTHCGTHIIDTHDKQVTAEVWKLYSKAKQYCPHAATLLEWDSQIPDFNDLLEELHKAKAAEKMQVPTASEFGNPNAHPHPVVMDIVNTENITLA